MAILGSSLPTTLPPQTPQTPTLSFPSPYSNISQQPAIINVPQSYPSYIPQPLATIPSAYQNAVSNISNAIQNTYTTINNSYNNASQDVYGALSAQGNNILTAIHASSDNASRDITNALSHISNTIDAVHTNELVGIRDSINQIGDRIQAADQAIIVGTRVDLSPIDHIAQAITSGIRDNIVNNTHQQEQTINTIHDAINQEIRSQADITTHLIDNIDTTINTGFAKIISDINDRTQQKPNLGLFDDPITKAIIDFIIQHAREMLVSLFGETGTDVLNWSDERLKYASDQLSKAPDDLLEIFNDLLDGKYRNIDEFITVLRDRSNTGFLLNLVLIIITLLTSANKLASIISEPYFFKLSQLSMTGKSVVIPSINELSQMLIRGLISNTQWENFVSELGYSKDIAQQTLFVNLRHLQPNEYMFNDLLFTPERKINRDNLQQLGFNDNDIDILSNNYLEGIPPVPDLIRMMVRNVFSPIAEQQGFFEEFPDEIMKFWHAQPVGDRWAKLYWGSHWQVPSVGQSYQLYHRGQIDLNTLHELLKLNDIAPKFREGLINIAYNPLTRVDIRRLYNSKILDEQGVIRAYLDDGYSPENARRLTDFTIHSNDETDTVKFKHIRDLTKELIKKTYEREMINETEAIDQLVRVDVPRQEAELIVKVWEFDKNTLHDYNRNTSDKERLIKLIKDSYRDRVIDRSFASSYLLAIGQTQDEINIELKYLDFDAVLKLKKTQYAFVEKQYSSHRITREEALSLLTYYGANDGEKEYLIQFYDMARQSKDKHLSETALNKAYTQGIIDLPILYNKMAGLGYSDEDIDIIIQLDQPKPPKPKQGTQDNVT